MKEISVKYHPESNLDQRRQVMKSQEYYWAAHFAKGLLINGDSYENYDELITEAIALRDKLIERVNSKK